MRTGAAYHALRIATTAAFLLLGPCLSAQSIEVDFAQRSPIDPALYGRYLNFTGGGQVFTQADFELYQAEFGRLKLVRIWGTARIDYAAQVADEALMVLPRSINLKGLVHGSVSEDDSVAAVERVLGPVKEKYPFVTHIEPFNELTAAGLDLPKGVSVEEAYYRGFRVAYRAANELNRKNAYALPILVGGPACMWPQFKSGYVREFLACYAEDPDPSKRLDFISVHYYPDDYQTAIAFRRNIEAALMEYRLPAIPLIMSEIGWKEKGARAHDGNPKDALRWATGALAHTYQIAEQDVLPMHWVYPRKEDRHTMVAPADEPPALLPKGNAIKLAQMLKKTHVRSATALDDAGNGVYSVATFDESGVAVLVFNYDGRAESHRTVTLRLLHCETIPAQSGRMTEYVLDRHHANYYADKNAWRLTPVDLGTRPLSSFDGTKVEFDGNAACLLLMSFAK